jgi:hypothetical protein
MRDPFKPRRSKIYTHAQAAEWDIRKLMKPWLLLPARTKINENAPMIIRGRGERGSADFLYWSGEIEEAPKGISHIIDFFDQHAQRIVLTNHVMFVQGTSKNKSSSNIKRINTSEFSKEGRSIVSGAVHYNPYRLFVIDRDNPPIPLNAPFRPIIQNDHVPDYESSFNIRILPYYTSSHVETPTALIPNPQGVQP